MKFTVKIRTFLERHKLTRDVVPYLRRTFIVRMIHTYEGHYGKEKNSQDIQDFLLCYKNNKEEFEKVYNILEDDKSRETYKAIIKFRETYNYKTIKNIRYYPQYFVKEIFDYKDEVFVDGGAYIGDTIFSMLKYVPLKSIKKIYAWEADEKNSDVLQHEVGKALLHSKIKLECIPCALWREKTTLEFDSFENDCSHIGRGGIFVQADTIDNRCPDATFIKMDIEGAEIDALYGAKNTIINNKPKLAICIYHSNKHLYEIPLLIHEWVPEYKLYIRHSSEMRQETVLYAVINK